MTREEVIETSEVEKNILLMKSPTAQLTDIIRKLLPKHIVVELVLPSHREWTVPPVRRSAPSSFGASGRAKNRKATKLPFYF